MTTNDIKQLATSLSQADATEAARIWVNVASNKTLAIKVHEQLTREERLGLAQKLLKAENKKDNNNNSLI
tara:strand:- start:395 stop:604 length:210 start_codon:yes stop_codon:yes gene_type:complete